MPNAEQHPYTQVLRQQEVWDRGGGWGNLHGDIHMVAVSASCRNALSGTEWANWLYKSAQKTLFSPSFLAVKPIWALNECLLAEIAD